MNESRFQTSDENGSIKNEVRNAATLRHIFDNLTSENEAEQVNMRKFIGAYYDKGEVVTDMERSEAEAKKYNDILKDTLRETVFLLGQKFNWFGKDANTGQTSKYDQKLNGVDLVIVYDDGEEIPLALNLIVDSANDKPLTRANEPLSIKYYQSPIDPEKHCAIDTALATVNFSKEDANELIVMVNDLITFKNKGFSKETDESNIKQMEGDIDSHPLRNKIIEEILSQLDNHTERTEKHSVINKEKINFLREKLVQALNENRK
ncbi:MAG: hypothetical protein WC457_04090 [Patescibacteria group bacterium]